MRPAAAPGSIGRIVFAGDIFISAFPTTVDPLVFYEFGRMDIYWLAASGASSRSSIRQASRNELCLAFGAANYMPVKQRTLSRDRRTAYVTGSSFTSLPGLLRACLGAVYILETILTRFMQTKAFPAPTTNRTYEVRLINPGTVPSFVDAIRRTEWF
jgi:hypothetical protein